MTEQHRHITRAVGWMSLATTVSRVLGYLRDSVSAFFFGASWVSDAFILAFRIPNLLRDLLAEGALSAAFIPAMAREREKRGDAASWQLAALMLNSMLILMGALVLAGLSLKGWLVALVAPGFKARPEQFELAVSLTGILFPFIALMGLAALFMGALNSRNRFGPGAVAPIFLNLTMLGFGAWMHAHPLPPEGQVLVWAWGALAGGLAQMLVQLPALFQEGFRPRLAWPFKSRGVLDVWKRMGPAVLGQSSTQVNLLVNSMLASQMAVGSATYLYYGNRLMQLPLGVFAVAISTAVLPALAAQHAREDADEFKGTLSFGLRLTLFITLPAALGLILLSEPINVLLFRWGHFDLEAARAAARASAVYSTQIVFASFIKVLGPAFYARDEAAVPVKVGFIGVLVNLLLSLSLMRPMGYLGLATAASVSSLVQTVLLLLLMRRRLGPMLRMGVLRDLGKIAVISGAMALAVWGGGVWMRHGVDPSRLYARSRLALEVGLLMGLAVAVYFPLAHFWGLDYLSPLLARRKKSG